MPMLGSSRRLEGSGELLGELAGPLGGVDGDGEPTQVLLFGG
jgi:hypothetical protein